MIGLVVTDKDGIPLDNTGKQLSQSAYQPPKEIQKLMSRLQTDYGVAWQLQHRPFNEFDGYSLLERANLDQQTFGAFVGCEYVPKAKSWRWRGRKNNARNKIMAILAQVLAGILVPTVFATDDQDNDSKECAMAMRVLVQEHLRRANYETKFMFMVLGALVNPATFVEIQYIMQMQRVKIRLANGETKVQEAIDELMSGLAMNNVPIDEILLGDFFTFDMQMQPYVVRVRRISYDVARGRYAGKHFDEKGKDLFDYVMAGKTRVFMASQENQTVYDVDWTEGDQNMVQEASFYYRGEDLQVTSVAGVFMGNFDYDEEKEVYNLNPFDHRRMTQVGLEWGSIPVYPFAKSGAEPLDPNGRFAYYKSFAFKEFWDDATLNVAHQLAVDGMKLDVMKPVFISGIAKYDSNVMAPGAVASLPKDAVVSPYQLGPNLPAAFKVITQEDKDMEDSTISNILRGQQTPQQTATAFLQTVANAKKMLGVIGATTADLIKQVGELAIDCVIMHTTVGELKEELPGSLGMKYQTILARSTDKGRTSTHKIVMTDRYMGRKMTEEQKRVREWELWHQAGGDKKDAMKITEINPYQFARRRYSCFVDVDELLDRSSGADEMRKQRALAVLTSPMVAAFTDMKNVVDDFAIDVYGGNDPDRYKKKGSANDMMNMMGATGQGGQPTQMTPQKPGAVDPAMVGLGTLQ